MKYLLPFCTVLVFCFNSVLAQVGIGTTNPNATLDIRSSNQVTPANNDGLLIPKIDEFPLANPTVAQDGMMVYVTGNSGTPTKGFYYWNATATNWIPVIGVKTINDLSDGKSDNDGTDNGSSVFLGVGAGLNDDGTNNQNLGVGYESLSFNVTGNRNTAIGALSLSKNTTGAYNTAIGSLALYNNVIGDSNVAVGTNSLVSNTSGIGNVAIGVGALNLNTGSENTALGNASGGFSLGSGNIFLGHESGFSEIGNNRLYIENTDANFDSALIYGEFGADNTTTGNILRTNSEFQIGNPTATGYAFPTTDGTNTQVLQTNGNGNLNWVNPNTITIHSINDLTDGKSDNDGTINGASIFLGVDAGLNDDGTENVNVGIGYLSLVNNLNGENNTALGAGSLNSNIDGDHNTALGASSLFNNEDGYSNTALGSRSLETNISGYYNVALGDSGLSSNTNGHNNTAIGTGSLSFNETGSDNIAIGTFSGSITSNLSDNITIGNYAGENETNSNRLYIENSDSTTPLIYGEFDTDILGFNANVGIGTQTPQSRLHVTEEGISGVQTIVAGLASNTSNRPVLQFSETNDIGLAEGMSIEYNGTGAGSANRMVINDIGGNPLFEFRNGGSLTLREGDLNIQGTATDREIRIADDAGNNDRALMRQTGTQDIYVGDIDNNGGDLFMRAGGSTEISILAGTGFVGINTLTPAFTLEVNGNAAKPGSASWIVTSDKRLKQNIKTYTDGLETLLKINPVTYHYNTLSGFDQNPEYIGVIAQELQKVAPYMVTSYKKEKTDYLAVDNSAMTYMLINAVKTQQAQITVQKEEIEGLKKELKVLSEALKQIQTLLMHKQ